MRTLTLGLALACGFAQAAATSAGGVEESQPSADSVSLQTSSWGEWHQGLQCKATTPRTIEQGMLLNLSLEFRSNPEELEPGVRQLNTFLHDAFMTLTLQNSKMQKTLAVQPYDPTLKMPCWDRGKATVTLDGTEMPAWDVSFPLARLEAALEPGVYDCTVQFAFPKQKTRWWHDPAGDWVSFGFWSGTVACSPFRLEVTKETPKTQQFLFPKRLRLLPGWRVNYGKEDALPVNLRVSNGYGVGGKYYRDGEFYMLFGPPLPDDVNPIDNWCHHKGGDRTVSYTIEVFETYERPEHFWQPAPGKGGYKVLWKKTFNLSASEEEIRALGPCFWEALLDGNPPG